MNLQSYIIVCLPIIHTLYGSHATHWILYMKLLKTLRFNGDAIVTYDEPKNLPWKVFRLTEQWGLNLCD